MYIVRCLTSARNFKKSLNKSADARPGTGRCPSGHLPMFYESNCHGWEATCFCRSAYCIFIDILPLKTKKTSMKNIYFAWAAEDDLHETNKWYWIFCSLEQVWFSSLSLSESASIFLILTTSFFGEMMTNFDINVFIIARENSYWISYNAGRAPYNILRCPAGHRPMFP